MRTAWCDCAIPRSFIAHPDTGEYVHSDPRCLRPTPAIYAQRKA